MPCRESLQSSLDNIVSNINLFYFIIYFIILPYTLQLYKYGLVLGQ